MLKKKSFTVAIFLLFSINSHAENKAGLFLEPSITYESNNFEVDYPSPFGNSKGKTTGLGAGLRLGLHAYNTLFVGFDARYNKVEFNDSDNDFRSEGSAYNYGPVVGLQIPANLGIRIWGGYVLNGQLDPQKDNGLDVKFEKASGYRIGGGIILGTLSLNYEYIDIKYNKSKLESIGSFSTSTDFDNVELHSKGHVISLSSPIDF